MEQLGGNVAKALSLRSKLKPLFSAVSDAKVLTDVGIKINTI